MKLRKNRSGTATLEFVLGFPFLMLLAATIFVVAYASMTKTNSVSQARYEVWKMRDKDATHELESYSRVDDTKPMQLLNFEDEMPGEIVGSGSDSFKTYKWAGGTKTAKSKTMLVSGTWDHKEITEFTDRPGGPHLDILGKILGIDGGFLSTINDVLGFLL
jgi:hypothetical protein